MKAASLIRNSIRNLKRPSYSALPEGVVRMNDNSNLFMQNPAVRKTIEKFDFDLLRAYPTPFADDLREVIAERFGISPEGVIVGNGSDEIIDLAVKVFVDAGDRVTISVPTFEMYSMYVAIAGGQIVECPLREDSFQLDVEAILSSDPKMIFVGSPNNPTGNLMNARDILRIADESNAIIILDEAYADFAGNEELSQASYRENVITLRTFSKAFGLSGLRIGFGMGDREPISSLAKACAPFRLNRLSESIAIEALADRSFVRQVAKMAREERKRVADELTKLGVRVFPSDTNFLLFRPPIPVAELIDGLMASGIAIRDCSRQRFLDNCARVTFGNRNLNERFIDAVRNILGEGA